MRNYREYMRDAIKSPVDDGSAIGFGRWAILNQEQRKLIGRLLDEMDRADEYIKKLYEENQKLKTYIQYYKEHNPQYYKGDVIYGIDKKSST